MGENGKYVHLSGEDDLRQVSYSESCHLLDHAESVLALVEPLTQFLTKDKPLDLSLDLTPPYLVN